MFLIKLWIVCIYQTVKNGFSLYRINDTEVLGRTLFDGFGYNKRTGKIRTMAFKQKKVDREISVNRLSLAPFKWFVKLSQQDAKRRSIKAKKDIEFCGFAEIETSKLRATTLQNNKKFTVSGTPEYCRNPFHASIMIQPDDGKDFELYIRQALRRISVLHKYLAE